MIAQVTGSKYLYLLSPILLNLTDILVPLAGNTESVEKYLIIS